MLSIGAEIAYSNEYYGMSDGEPLGIKRVE
jgi:hypothetical protein